MCEKLWKWWFAGNDTSMEWMTIKLNKFEENCCNY